MSRITVTAPATTRDTTDWRDQAACIADPDAMFPDTHPADIDTALGFCRACPVLDECRAFALNERIEYGVWGGTTEDQRRDYFRAHPVPRQRNRPVTGKPGNCGTERGYKRHTTRKTPTCDACLAAHNAYEAEKRTARTARREGVAV